MGKPRLGKGGSDRANEPEHPRGDTNGGRWGESPLGNAAENLRDNPGRFSLSGDMDGTSQMPPRYVTFCCLPENSPANILVGLFHPF